MGDLFNDAVHPALNWYAVIVAGIAGFMVGGIWYSKLGFASAWMKLTGITEADTRKGDAGRLMGMAALLTILIAYNIARLMLRGGGWEAGAKVGVYVGAAIVCANGVNFLFERKPFQLWLIHSGHQLLSSVLIGAILGAWR